MDKTTLVKGDIDIEGLILDALNRAKIPVTLFRRHYVPQLEEWQFVIATPWHDRKGPLATYEAVIDAFQEAGIYEDVPMRRVLLRSPQDPLVARLEKEDQREGFLHVLRHPGTKEDYSVIFAPITGAGGPVPAKHFPALERLRKFLHEELSLRRSLVDDALAELEVRRSSSILPVYLGDQDLKKLGH